MKVDEVRINAQLTVGIEIDSATGRLWVIEAIKDICNNHPKAGARVSESVAITAGGTDYAIVGTLLELISIEDTNQSVYLPSASAKYVLNDDNTITFAEAGAYQIKYMGMPAMPQTTSSEIPLPQLFVPCIEYYLAYKIRGRLYGQSDGNAVSFFQQYEYRRDNAEIMRGKKKIKRQIPSRGGGNS